MTYHLFQSPPFWSSDLSWPNLGPLVLEADNRAKQEVALVMSRVNEFDEGKLEGDGLCSSTSVPWRHVVHILNLALPFACEGNV